VSVAHDDLLMSAGPLPVVQWHFDAVTALPPSAELLASSEGHPVQAFRIGEVAWGLQFHLEATLAMVTQWAALDADALAAQQRTGEQLVAELTQAQPQLLAAGEQLVRRFAQIITG
jgi:GMP synthase-like glutamine amidotransferase